MYVTFKRDIIKRFKAHKIEVKYVILKSLFKNKIIKKKYKNFFFKIFLTYCKCSSRVRCNNFCWLTFRSKSIIRFFGLERFILKQKVMYNRFPGIKYKIK